MAAVLVMVVCCNLVLPPSRALLLRLQPTRRVVAEPAVDLGPPQRHSFGRGAFRLRREKRAKRAEQVLLERIEVCGHDRPTLPIGERDGHVWYHRDESLVVSDELEFVVIRDGDVRSVVRRQSSCG